MSRDKYSVLLMRDDTRVKRFRFSPLWLKLMLYCFLLLAVAAAGGGYAGFTFWKSNSLLRNELQSLERELRETRLDLERLQNVEKILKSNDPEELQSLFGSITVHPEGDNASQAAPPPPPSINLAKLFKRVDNGEARLDNIILKDDGDGTLKLSFDINNTNQNKALSGNVKLVFLTADGQSHAIDAKEADLSFLIQRYKKIVTSFVIPAGLTQKDIFGLRMTIITSEGDIIFSDTFQIARLMAS
ncbi:MAG: hypothetical protein AB7E47_14660 [Desulfovibrionaceae bacterium]